MVAHMPGLTTYHATPAVTAWHPLLFQQFRIGIPQIAITVAGIGVIHCAKPQSKNLERPCREEILIHLRERILGRFGNTWFRRTFDPL
jgi:hypothetical protein